MAMGVPAKRINWVVDIRQVGSDPKANEGYWKKLDFMQLIIAETLNRELWDAFNVEMMFKGSYKLDQIRGANVLAIAAPSGAGGVNAIAEAVMYNIGVSSFVLDQDTIEISAVDEQSTSRTIQSSVSNLVTVLGQSYDVESNITYDSELNKKSWNSDGVNNNNPVEVNTTLRTTSDYLSPVVDTDRCNVKLIRNRILTDTAKTSRYITRTIPLASAADQLDIYFDVNRPSTACDIEVYGQFDNGEWTAVPRISPLTLPANSNPDEFSEVHYTLSPTSLFTEFKMKIVFKSSNIVDVPRVKNLRAIASLQ
jgi:hypothetical protein